MNTAVPIAIATAIAIAIDCMWDWVCGWSAALIGDGTGEPIGHIDECVGGGHVFDAKT